MKFWANQRNGVTLRPDRALTAFFAALSKSQFNRQYSQERMSASSRMPQRKRGLFGITSASGNCDPDRAGVISKVISPRSPFFSIIHFVNLYIFGSSFDEDKNNKNSTHGGTKRRATR